MKCVVVAQDEGLQNLIAAALESLGMDATLIASLGELPATLQELSTSGILLELTTSVKASSAEKEVANELVQLYPFARCKFVEGKLFVLGKQSSIEAFVHACQEFKPRTTRRTPREIKHLSVRVFAEGVFEGGEKCVTTNVSEAGCFVYSVQEWIVGDRVRLCFSGNGPTALGTVCHWHPWGNDRLIPGIGVRFDEATTGV
jgi:hypothetical protein